MRKSFEEVLNLSADNFAAYFNSRVLEALGRAGARAHLTAAEQDRIKESRCGLYEKLKKAGELQLTASIKAIYSELEEEHIKAAKAALQSGLDTAPAAGAGADGAVVSLVVSEAASLSALNSDLVKNIASYLLPQERVVLVKASKSANTGLKGILNPERAKAIKKFLHHVARGEQAEAEAMLRVDRSLLIQSGEFTDYSGRRFICSAYEYAYWAKDTHMRRMLETHMDEKAKAILRKRIERMEEIDPATRKARGLLYWQKGIKHQSAHFDLAPLITALQAYVNGFDAWATGSLEADSLEAAWLKVGLAQREIPAHVAQEYCRPDRSFHPTPAFTEPTLPRVLFFYDPRTDGEDSWFPLVSPASGLGIDFSLGRWAHSRVMVMRWEGAGDMVLHDLAAMRRLDEVRTADLIQSRDHLNPAATSSRLGR